MSNRLSDTLFQLIKSLEKSEKRNFKLYIKRSSGNEDLKIIELFDTMDKLEEYDEAILLRKLSSIKKPQLSNIKIHLYKQLLASLRLLKSTYSIDMQLNEQLDFARILYNKGLYLQSLKILEKLKETAIAHNKNNFLTQVIAWEKKIESLHFTRSMLERGEALAREAIDVNEKVNMVSRLSNLSIQLYSWFLKYGHARNEKDVRSVAKFVDRNLPKDAPVLTGFYERMYLYQSYSWYAFIRQDFLYYYKYAQKWVDIFKEEPQMLNVETGFYIKGMRILLNALFNLRNYQRFEIELKHFSDFAKSDVVTQHVNHKVQTFIYITRAQINQHFMLGTFAEGLKMVPMIEEKIEEYDLFLDNPQILILNFKIATLYFGNGNYSTAIDYLQKIIMGEADLRSDLQSYARLMHIMAHYELGNYEIIESLIKSVYRFMSKMENLTLVEEEMFKFLRKSINVHKQKRKPLFELLLSKIKHLEKKPFETRSFTYLDIISWVESKIYDKPMGEIIHEKYLNAKVRKY